MVRSIKCVEFSRIPPIIDRILSKRASSPVAITGICNYLLVLCVFQAKHADEGMDMRTRFRESQRSGLGGLFFSSATWGRYKVSLCPCPFTDRRPVCRALVSVRQVRKYR